MWRTSSFLKPTPRLTRDAMLNIPARVVNEITALVGGWIRESRAILILRDPQR